MTAVVRVVFQVRDSLFIQTLVESIGNILKGLKQLFSLPGLPVKLRKLQRWTWSAANYPSELLAVRQLPKWRRKLPRSVRRSLRSMANISLVEPTRWLVQLAGVAYRWGVTRNWRRILVSGAPALALVSVPVLSLMASRVPRRAITRQYLELAEVELNYLASPDFSALPIVAGGGDSATDSRDRRAVALPPPADSLATLSSDSLSEYCQLLLRRVQLLHPGNQGRFLVGSLMLRHGLIDEGLKELGRIAPDESSGDLRAHGLIAAVLLQQYLHAPNAALLDRFRHHAELGTRWEQLPTEVLIALGELHWISGNGDRALQLLQGVAQQVPEIYPRVVHIATVTGLTALAESARSRGIDRLEHKLSASPENDLVRVLLVQLMNTTEDQLLAAEKLLRAGLVVRPSRIQLRALSEVYRQQYALRIAKGKDPILNLPILCKALEAYPDNPSIAEQFEQIIQDAAGLGAKHSEQLRLAVGRLLAAGSPPIGLHALLGQYHLRRHQPAEAIIHLEQVYRLAPSASQFTNHLIRAYLALDQSNQAVRMAAEVMPALRGSKPHLEPPVDELLETLGEVFQRANQLSEAVEAFEMSLNVNPSRHSTREQIIVLYRQLDQPDQAESHQRASARLAPAVQTPPLFSDWTLGNTGLPLLTA